MDNDGVKGIVLSPASTLEGGSEASGGQDFYKIHPNPLAFGIFPVTIPRSSLILGLPKSRGWTGQLLKALPAKELNSKHELTKGAGCLDTLLHEVQAVGISGRIEMGGVERGVYRGQSSRSGRQLTSKP